MLDHFEKIQKLKDKLMAFQTSVVFLATRYTAVDSPPLLVSKKPLKRSQKSIPRMVQLFGLTCAKNPLSTSMATQSAHVHQTRLENMPSLATLPVPLLSLMKRNLSKLLKDAPRLM